MQENNQTFDVIYTDQTFDVIYTDQTFDVIYTDQTFDVIYTDQTFDVMYTDQTFDVIYTDFSKDFDSVPHERLLRLLEHLGIHGDLLNWIRSLLRYTNLHGRKFLVGFPKDLFMDPCYS